jgi:hypothetical protein
LIALAIIMIAPPIVNWAIPISARRRMVVAVVMLVPIGVALGIPMPTSLRMLSLHSPQCFRGPGNQRRALILGATLAIFSP